MRNPKDPLAVMNQMVKDVLVRVLTLTLHHRDSEPSVSITTQPVVSPTVRHTHGHCSLTSDATLAGTGARWIAGGPEQTQELLLGVVHVNIALFLKLTRGRSVRSKRESVSWCHVGLAESFL